MGHPSRTASATPDAASAPPQPPPGDTIKATKASYRQWAERRGIAPVGWRHHMRSFGRNNPKPT
jgi:hypothetical protein